MKTTGFLSRLVAAASLMSVTGFAQADLDVAISANPDPVQPGETIQVALTVTNSDGFARSGVQLQMPYPAGLEDVSHGSITGGGICAPTVSNNGACDSGETIVWNLGALEAGRGITVQLPSTVLAGTAAGTVIVFNPQVTDSLTESVSASESVAVIGDRVLELALSETGLEPVQADGTMEYQLSWGYSATSAAVTGASLSLPVPPGLTFVSADNGGALVGNTVQWNLNTLTPGLVGERRAVFMVSAGQSAGSAIEAEALMQGSGAVQTRAKSVTRVESSPGLLLAIEANASPAQPGEALAVLLTVTNSSFFDRADVTLRLHYPVGLQDLNHGSITDGGTCAPSVSNNGACDAWEVLTWDLDMMAAGTGKTVKLPPRIAASVAAGSLIAFNAEVTDVTGVVVVASETVEVVADRTLELALTEVGQEAVQLGNEVEYQLSWGYSETSTAATGVTLRMPVPAGLAFVSADNGGTLVGNTVQWNLGTLTPGLVGERRAIFTVDEDQPEGTLIKAEATISGSGNRLTRADELTRVEASSGLQLMIEANANPVEPGEAFGVTLTVANHSFVDRANVVLQMHFPQDLQNLVHGMITKSGTCIASVSNNGSCDSGEILSWNLGTIPAGTGVTVSLPPAIAAAVEAGSLVVMDAQLSDSAGLITSASETLAVVNDRTLELVMTEIGDGPVHASDEVEYQLSWGYSATSSAVTGVTLSMPVPDGLTFVSADNGGMLVGGTVQWSLGILTPGTVGERRAVFAVDASQLNGTAIKAEASLQDSGNLLTRADEVTRVEPLTGLQLAIEANVSPAEPDETVGVSLTVSNHSFFDRANVVLRMRYPQQLQGASHALITDVGTCAPSVSNNSACDSREILTWNLGTLAAGSGVTVNLSPSLVAAAAPGSLIVFNAEVTDSAGLFSDASEVVQVVNARTLELQLSEFTTEPMLPGQQATYVANWGYSATSSAATGVTLSLPVPQGMTFVSANGAGTLAGDNVEWNLGTVQPGYVGELSATFAIPANASYGTLFKAEALLQTADGRQVRADEVTQVAQEVPLRVTVNVSPNVADPGSILGGTLEVTNSSFFDRANVVLRMRYPLGLLNLSHGQVSDGGICAPGISNNSACDSGEFLSWNLGTVAGNSSRTVTLPPVIQSALAEGSLIPFVAWVEDGAARSQAADVVMVGEFFTVDPGPVDVDSDGVDDAEDNCLGVVNPLQQDTNGDGIGNHCDPDLNNDGVVNATDFNLLRAVFFTSGPDLDADFNQDGFVNFADLAILRIFYLREPGPSAFSD